MSNKLRNEEKYIDDVVDLLNANCEYKDDENYIEFYNNHHMSELDLYAVHSLIYH